LLPQFGAPAITDPADGGLTVMVRVKQSSSAETASISIPPESKGPTCAPEAVCMGLAIRFAAMKSITNVKKGVRLLGIDSPQTVEDKIIVRPSLREFQ
jgi:hypothetical protein